MLVKRNFLPIKRKHLGGLLILLFIDNLRGFQHDRQ